MTDPTVPVVKPAPTKNALDTFIDTAKAEVEKLFGGEKTLLSGSVRVYLSNGKAYVSSSESIGPATFTQPPLEIDPFHALHIAATGIAGFVGGIFGKKPAA